MSEHQTEPLIHEGAATVTEQQTAAETPQADVLAEMRKLKVDMTISKHVSTALGFGFIPVPLVDFVAVTGVQLDMVYRLCRIYEVDFSTQAVRAVIASLVGAGVPLQPLLTSGIKMIPGIGTAAGFFAGPALAGATTYAVGRVFVQHFETGGTLLTFDANKMKSHFERALSEGKNVVAGMRKA